MEARKEFLDLAEACGARISGKPDGSEPVEVIFSIDAWRAFDAAQSPAALAGEREAFEELMRLHREDVDATITWDCADSLEEAARHKGPMLAAHEAFVAALRQLLKAKP